MNKPDFDNRGKGCLFRNSKKESDSHADYSGSINIEGRDFWLNAWLKTSKAGAKYFSLSVKPKTDAAPKAAQKSATADLDGFDVVPF
jgi:hypothetical protein